MESEGRSERGLSVTRITVQTKDWQDSGIGIVIARRPLTLLVPSHLIELLEQGSNCEIQVNGVAYECPKIVPSPALQRDYLSVLRFSKRHPGGLSSAQLPRKRFHLTAGQSVVLQRSSFEPSSQGTVIDVREQGDGTSVITDIAVSKGDSGSPLLVDGRLAAVCQGMIQRAGTGSAIAVPLSADGLAELRGLRRRYRVNLSSGAIAALLAVVLALGGFAIYSSNSFALAGIEVAEDGSTVTAQNMQKLTVYPSWTRSFQTPIRRSLALSSKTNGRLDRVAIGTLCAAGVNGEIALLNSSGKSLWTYSVPDGECIYSTEAESYNGFLVDRIYTSDLNQDGNTELLVVFVHDHFFPCKLVVFSMLGDILAEYWHPGYIRTIVTGQVGESDDVLVLVSASNNALKTDFWNPQTLFAFRGLDIAGQAPPYSGTSGSPTALATGTELWTWVIVNIDPLLLRAKCTDFNITDVNGDGLSDIQVPLTDGRFYHLNESGDVLGIELADRYLENFPQTAPPPLVELWEYVEAAKANASEEARPES